MDSFERMQTSSLERLRLSTDLTHLKNELIVTEKIMPDCAAESLFRTNKISHTESKNK
jgi:hypothetical protein